MLSLRPVLSRALHTRSAHDQLPSGTQHLRQQDEQSIDGIGRGQTRVAYGTIHAFVPAKQQDLDPGLLGSDLSGAPPAMHHGHNIAGDDGGNFFAVLCH